MGNTSKMQYCISRRDRIGGNISKLILSSLNDKLLLLQRTDRNVSEHNSFLQFFETFTRLSKTCYINCVTLLIIFPFVVQTALISCMLRLFQVDSTTQVPEIPRCHTDSEQIYCLNRISTSTSPMVCHNASAGMVTTTGPQSQAFQQNSYISTLNSVGTYLDCVNFDYWQFYENLCSVIRIEKLHNHLRWYSRQPAGQSCSQTALAPQSRRQLQPTAANCSQRSS